MHCFLNVVVTGLYVRALRARNPDSDRILVAYRGGRVVEYEAEAAKYSVSAGMLLSEAKTLLRERGQFVEIIESEFETERNEWLDRVMVYSHLIQPLSAQEAVVDMGSHIGVGDLADLLARELMWEMGYGVRMGCAHSAWVARLAAAPVDRDAVKLGLRCVEVIDNCEEFLTGISTLALVPVREEIRQKLIYLGYRRIGQVRTAKLEVLIRQFGKEGVVVYEAALGKSIEKFVPGYPVESVCVSVQLGGVNDYHELLSVLRGIAGQMSESLRGRDKVAKVLQFVVHEESGARKVYRRLLHRPIQDEKSLLAGLEYSLKQVGVSDFVIGFEVLAHELSSAGSVQRAFDTTVGLKERLRSAELAIKRVKSALGESALKIASEIEVSRREQVMRAWRRSTGWRL